jgi:type III secretion system YscD/HrpQ family protein
MREEGTEAMALGTDGTGTEAAVAYQLRVLAGRHSGAVMPLPAGRYSMGQDEQADFIFLDDAFLGGQVIIDVTGVIPKLEVTGVVKAAVDGKALEAGQSLPLDSYQPVEVGATRFAIGPADRPWPEPPAAKAEAPAASPSDPDAVPAPAPESMDNWPPVAPGSEGAPKPAKGAKGAKGRVVKILARAFIALALAGALGGGAWYLLRDPVDPAAVLRGVLSELKLTEVKVVPQPGGFLLKGFLQTEAERDSLAKRIRNFTPPVKTRLVSAEETRSAIQGVLDLYKLECPITIGPMGKAVVACVIDNPRLAKEVGDAVRQGAPAEAEVDGHWYPTSVAFPFVNRMLSAKVLDHKIRLEVNGGRVYGVLVKNQMDSLEMLAWKEIQGSFQAQFGMPLEEKWTERLSPALLRFNAAARELDANLVGVTVGEMGYLTLRNRRKYFEGARLQSGPVVKSIQRDRVVLALDNVEQNYFFKKGAK